MNAKKSLRFFIIHFSFLIVNCFGQPQYHFKHYTTEHGLSQSSVFSITQDEIGFMWFATEDGLNKFDGNKFTVYRPIKNDSTSLTDLGIRKVLKDHSGTLWVLSLRGNICRYNQAKNNFTRFTLTGENIKDRIKIITIVNDFNKDLLAVSGKGEIFVFESTKQKFTLKSINKKLKEKLGSLHVQCVLNSSDGQFWIGTWEGLIRTNNNLSEYEFITSKGNGGRRIAGDMVFNLVEDNSGNIYVLSANGGLSVYLKSDDAIKIFKDGDSDRKSISSKRLMTALLDRTERLWIGTFDKGLILYDPLSDTFTDIVHEPAVESSISIGAVMSIYEDRSGGLWFGNGGGGINRYDPVTQIFKHYQHIPGNPSSISPNPVLSIYKDDDGNLYVGSDGGGLNIKEKGSSVFKTFLQNPVYGSNAITVISGDNKGNIWIGSDPGAHLPSGALIKYNKQTKTFTQIKDLNIQLGGISSILADGNGKLWITTPADGLHYYDPETKKEIVYRYDPDDSKSISSNSLFNIFEDSFGNMWIGSIASGLILFDRKNGEFKNYINNPDDNKSISNNAVWCVTEDSNKEIWIGTWGGGVNKFNRTNETFIRYDVESGLPGNIIYGIIPDDGNLWISTNKGLSQFNPAKNIIRNYDRSYGLMINDFSAGASFKSKDGEIYFGGNSGLISFYPSMVDENTYLPNVVITNFLVYDKPFSLQTSIQETKNIELEYDQNFFTLEFASLDFTAPEKNKFKYLLQGVDKNWVNSDGRNFASYTDLNNGEYVFRLKGSNSSGKFNEKETVLSIIINPPFWKTWWFRVLVIAALIFLLYSAHRYRLNKLLEVERTRIRIARDLHDEVSASITGIVYFADALSNQVKEDENPSAKKLIGLIGESSMQIQESMSDIIWSINPDNDDWKTVLPKIRRYISDLCESKNIEYQINMSEELPLKTLKMDQRHDIWLMFKEIITNSVKHSGCNKLMVSFIPDSEFLNITISDNGIGFDEQKINRNSGLKNIRSRLNNLNATWELITSEGNGTKWVISIPLSKYKTGRVENGKK